LTVISSYLPSYPCDDIDTILTQSLECSDSPALSPHIAFNLLGTMGIIEIKNLKTATNQALLQCKYLKAFQSTGQHCTICTLKKSLQVC